MTGKERAALQKKGRCIGNNVYHTPKGGKRNERFLLGIIDDVISVIAGDCNHMVQRIKLRPEIADEWRNGYAYRTCYYSLAKLSRKPVWGQYNAVVTQIVYRQLARKARAKGWLGF
jgi:hypothetical protein